jgi:Putative porin
MKLTMAAALVVLLAGTGWGQTRETDDLKRKVEEQGRQIEQLQQKLERLEQALLGATDNVRPFPEPVARVIPVSATALEIQPRAVVAQPAQPLQAPTPVAQAPATQAQTQIAGFRFGGDFRFRFDASVRSASSTTSGLQNIRQRYRLRLNVDRDLFTDLNFHMQFATGAVNNGITFDQDFAGGVTRHPFFISEAFIEYKPVTNVSLRGGKLEEVFADNSRFLFDDDVRFNGFNERWKLGKVEFRAGQYFFVNPNVYSVPPGSPLTLAGVEPGTIARAATMFHQGLTFDTALSERWHSQAIADIQLFRNPNLIALTSHPNGFAATLNPAIGLMLSGPAPGTGNATTSQTNAILSAPHYQVARAAYKLDANRLGGNARLPLSWSVQVARNVGTSELRDAIMTTLSVGRTQEKGDIRGLYTFAIKDANSMISQLTDDDLGTTVGVNIATHHFRLDYALRRGIVFQNLVFRQTERRPSNPADSFFVPLGRGTPTTWRYQGQLAISF